MDISQALVAKSDQLNASDLTGAPIVATIQAVRKGDAAKPVIVDLAGMDGRPWKPSKGMLRVIANGWGTESDVWVGRSVKLINNPEVIYAGEKVGGVEVTAMSHLDKPFTIPVRISQKKVKQHTVEVLAEPVTEPWQAQWQAIRNALGAAGYEGDGPTLLASAGQVIGTEWKHPNQISAEDAQKILAAVREDNDAVR
ncbi:hypothetical protein LJ753_16645 [Arthrobacter sp. zg-Y20]|uniref:hypothetical protein n=1 Tax=unclassified Arthrobacter TaxID=235627 RepID=UPI001D157891|nr:MULTISPECIES: hypothetical protein [unclassified Arthrobacter]MCC3277494.1 hypothetical protein [Arthrobacter sp. zg-Y20]MDK1317654.1 hypothetical protein [Arthrobacter sp. zg.Y20]WIB07086.1 hypothetical protein QNO06_04980 [Arthrobacter sp. zg-Y20]